MILELALSSFVVGGLTTQGSGDTARYVSRKVAEERRRLQATRSVGFDRLDVIADLYRVRDEARIPDWDGYGARPVTIEAVGNAQRFLEALPLGTPAPFVGAEPDGHISLEWYRSPHHTLSISISPEGTLHYAALVGTSRTHGSEAFFGTVPKSIIDLIHRVRAA